MKLLITLLALGALAAPLDAQTRCSGGAAPRPDYGISLACENCTIAEFGNSASWTFSSEPRITAVHTGGAARGALQAGDEIVRVNGYQITTEQGAAAFANPTIGRTTVFTVRRAGSLRTAQVKPTGTCPETSRSTAVVSAPSSGTSLPRVPRASVPGGGWLGIGFGCSECAMRFERNGTPEWKFSTPPEVYSIDPSSPAYRSGLRRGDVVTHVDGVAVTDAEGGRKLAAIKPGQTVTITYRRDGRARTATVRATDLPSRSSTTYAPARVNFESETRELIELQERVSAAAERLNAESEQRTQEQLLRRLRTQAEQQSRALERLESRLRDRPSDRERDQLEREIRELRERGGHEQQQVLSELLSRQAEETQRLQELQRQLQGAGTRVPLVRAGSNVSASSVISTRRLNYSGTVGDAEVEVRGSSPVVVTRDGDAIVIQVGENIVKVTQKK